MWAFVVLAVVGQAADVVNLRDGSSLRGQIVEPATRGKVAVVVRRDWLRAAYPDRARTWEAEDQARSGRARDDRKRRLRDWRRDRHDLGDRDPIAAWIDQEIARLDGPGATPPLMRIELEARQVRAIDRRSSATARLLREAWRAKLDDPESRPVEQLEAELNARGLDLGPVDRAPLDDLLPLPVESEARWLLRRAATEVKEDSGLRFLRYQDLVLPEESQPGAGTIAAAAGSLLQGLLGDAPAEDPLTRTLRGVATRRRVGVVLTRLDMAGDLRQVRVEATLLVRLGPDSWVPAFRHPITTDARSLPAGAGQPLEADPQVQAAFRTLEALGLGSITPDLKEQSLAVGAATRVALQQAQAALQRDLENVALPIRR